jgi:hypothetical protein
VKFIEKARELHPNLSDEEIISEICPYEDKLEKPPSHFYCRDKNNTCVRCWNEEMPEVIT